MGDVNPTRLADAFDSGRIHKWGKVLGTGQYGVVVMATNTKTNETVAIKMIPTTNHESLYNKLKPLKQLSHPNILEYQDIWPNRLSPKQMKDLAQMFPNIAQHFQLPPLKSNNPLTMVNLELRYCCNDNLRQYLKTTTNSLPQRLQLIKELTLGLEYLHSQKIIHGHFKPETILIEEKLVGGIPQNQIQISDFGLSSLIGKGPAQLKPEDSIYVAPESASDTSWNPTESGELYAMGIIWMELMHLEANQNGFHQNSEKETEYWTSLQKFFQNFKEKKIFPENFHPDQYFRKLILDMLEKDVKKRPSAANIVEILDLSLRRRVEGWSRLYDEMEGTFEIGDLIEINRAPCTHWTLYVGDGQVVHFKPVKDEGKESAANSESFHPAVVSVAPLKDVVGVCLIRLNNKPDTRVKVRPFDEMMKVVKKLSNRPKILYSLAYFNSEHLMTFLKFVGVSFSSQIMDNRKLFYQIKMHEKKNLKDIEAFNKFAYEQWIEILNTDQGHHPDYHQLEKRVQEWGK